MKQEPGARPRQALRGSWIPWIFVAGFGVVVAVNAAMVYVAATTWTGISVNRAYDKGLLYNRNLEAAARMAALGWEASIATERTGERTGIVAVALTEAGGGPLQRADVVIAFERPTHEGHDFVVPLAPDGSGRYSAPFAAPLEGIWDLRLIVTRDGDLFVTTERVFLK